MNKELLQPTSADYAMGYAEGFNDACGKPTIKMTNIAQQKLDHLIQQGYTINGYAIERSGERGLITIDGKVCWLTDDKPFSVTDLQTQFPALACALALWQLAPRNEHPASWNAFLLVETELEKILNFCSHQRKPVAYSVYFPTEQRQEYCTELDELSEDMTNLEHEVQALYSR